LQYLFLFAALTAAMASTPALSATTSDYPAARHSHGGAKPPAAARKPGAKAPGSATIYAAAKTPADLKTQIGTASHYGRAHAGRMTASGERFNPEAMTCAHRTLPLGSVVKVTDIATGKQVSVKVNDRGPYIRGRILDLSERAARELGGGDHGLLHVSIEVTDDGLRG
jgi:rare lipoprotein A (peptidoglycan hydrolase)